MGSGGWAGEVEGGPEEELHMSWPGQCVGSGCRGRGTQEATSKGLEEK